MKKIFAFPFITVLIFSILFISGCKTKENTQTSTTSAENKHTENVVTQIEAFPNGVFINDVEISNLTPLEAIAKVENEFLGEFINIVSGNITVELSYKALDCDFSEFEAFVDENFAKHYRWAKEGKRAGDHTVYLYNFDMMSVVDTSTLDSKVVSLFQDDSLVATKDAYVSVDLSKGAVSIVPEVYGNCPKDGVIAQKLKECIDNHGDRIELTEEDYIVPMILSDDSELSATKKLYETILNKTVYIGVCGLEEKISGNKLRSLLKFSDGVLSVNEDALTQYVKSLKASYDTYQTARQFKTSTNEIVEITLGTYGWQIDTKETVANISAAIMNSKKKPLANAAYSVKGQRPANDEYAGSYVEISLEHQHIWMYVNGVRIVDDDICSGDVTVEGKNTRKGMFFLKYKKKDVVLRGADYAEPVSYWMPYDRNIGIHDATWRTDDEFGGTNYIGNGSHGCVNLRLETAKTVYENLTSDMPIIVW